ncbi:hypothetical protein TEQG_01801 [Trichophyton equinum CBS 127.97]|uniref:Uncharacterized protein n=1 Tax=Trichophyton equinum (strain ATCC MYA-4606 / CBS 127.97) TaxID=559882 RepID=F2PLJ6_TRIEC|nr:hypothetical protein TEQG_01801 [Trichophyton equinum CBS 127.97]
MPSFPFRRHGGAERFGLAGPLDHSGIQPGRTMASVLGRHRYPYIHAPGPGFRSAEHLLRQPHPQAGAPAHAHQQDIPMQTRHCLFNEPPGRHQLGPRTQAHMAAHQLARSPEPSARRAVPGGHRSHQPATFMPMFTPPRARAPPLELDSIPPRVPIAVRHRRDGRHHRDPWFRPLMRRRLHDASDTHTEADRAPTLHESDWSSDDESLLGVPSFLREAHDKRHRRRKGRGRDHSKDRDFIDSSDESLALFYLEGEFDEPYLSDRHWDGTHSFVRRRPEDMYWWHSRRL